MARPAISQESGMRVVTARTVSAPARSPKPTSMSAPGQPDRPRRTAAPAAIQAPIGISVLSNARTDSPNIEMAHRADITLADPSLRAALDFGRTNLRRAGLFQPPAYAGWRYPHIAWRTWAP